MADNLDPAPGQPVGERPSPALNLEAMSRLARGIGHDLNNLLTVINGYAELLLTTLAADHPARPWVVEIRRAGDSGATLTRQLVALGRSKTSEPRAVDLNASVRELAGIVGRLLGEDITLTMNLGPATGAVWADPGEVDQLVLQLAANARDAMPHGGGLTVATADVILDTAAAAAHPGLRPGRHALLSVSDTGSGSGPEETARPALAAIRELVHQMGGHIAVASAAGAGTTVAVHLPCGAGPEGPPAGPTLAAGK